jgi:hypothetical protein
MFNNYAAYLARAKQHGGQPVDEAAFVEYMRDYRAILEMPMSVETADGHPIWTAEQELRMDALEAALFLYMDEGA